MKALRISLYLLAATLVPAGADGRAVGVERHRHFTGHLAGSAGALPASGQTLRGQGRQRFTARGGHIGWLRWRRVSSAWKPGTSVLPGLWSRS